MTSPIPNCPQPETPIREMAWTDAQRTEAMRADFESWMVNDAKIIVGSSDPYPSGLERDYWQVWQAALAPFTTGAKP